MPWTEDDDLPVPLRELERLKRFIDIDDQDGEGDDGDIPGVDDIQSQTLSFLNKYCVIDPQRSRYFRKVFETFDQDKRGYLDQDQVRKIAHDLI